MLSAEEKMRPNAPPLPEYQQRYAATKIVRLFRTLKRLKFTGQVIWCENSTGDSVAHGQIAHRQKWIVFLEQGDLRYGTGGSHSLRRWLRHLFACCPRLSQAVTFSAFRPLHAPETATSLAHCWEYRQLDRLVQQRQIMPQMHAQIIERILIELLFDVAQAIDVSYQLQRYPSQADQLAAIERRALAEEKIYAAIETQWHQWVEAELSAYSPNLAPIVRQPEYLRAETSPQVFQTLMTLLDGRHPLRDLAIKTQRAVQPFMQVLVPYVQSGWIELLEIPDVILPAPPSRPAPVAEVTPPLIACIDDSLMICQSMEQVIRAAGYRFIAITEASRAIATLLTKKPDIIFLDLIMPDTNGYEICSQLRKVSRFQETPIIILTGNDGIVDQVRARLLGATDFLSKPMEPAVILSIIQRFIAQRSY